MTDQQPPDVDSLDIDRVPEPFRQVVIAANAALDATQAGGPADGQAFVLLYVGPHAPDDVPDALTMQSFGAPLDLAELLLTAAQYTAGDLPCPLPFMLAGMARRHVSGHNRQNRAGVDDVIHGAEAILREAARDPE